MCMFKFDPAMIYSTRSIFLHAKNDQTLGYRLVWLWIQKWLPKREDKSYDNRNDKLITRADCKCGS